MRPSWLDGHKTCLADRDKTCFARQIRKTKKCPVLQDKLCPALPGETSVALHAMSSRTTYTPPLFWDKTHACSARWDEPHPARQGKPYLARDDIMPAKQWCILCMDSCKDKLSQMVTWLYHPKTKLSRKLNGPAKLHPPDVKLGQLTPDMDWKTHFVADLVSGSTYQHIQESQECLLQKKTCRSIVCLAKPTTCQQIPGMPSQQ